MNLKFLSHKRGRIIISKIWLKLTIENIDNESAVEALFDELEKYPYIQSATITWGGLFGKSEKRDFYVERMFEDVLPRVVVQQFEMKRLNKKSIRDLINNLEGQVRELKEQLKGLEYSG